MISRRAFVAGAAGSAAMGGVEAQAQGPLTREAVVETLQRLGFMTGATVVLGQQPYRLERVQIRSKGEGEFSIDFSAKPA